MKLEIRTYAELLAIVNAWATKKRMPLLAVTSRPGLGKTEAARTVASKLQGEHSAPLTLDTHVTPMHLYVELYNHRDQPVILDDLTDRVLSNPIALSILKSLCDSREQRRVEYNSSALYLDQHDIPRAFETHSPVLLLSNVFAVVSPAQIALSSRAVHADFLPARSEIIAYVRSWAKDSELVDFFAVYGEQFPWFSARDYAVCEQLKASGLDWSDYAMRSADAVLAEVLKLQTTFNADPARIAAFSGSRATYYRKLALLRNCPTPSCPTNRTRVKLGRPSKRPDAIKLANKSRSKLARHVIGRDGKPVPF